MIGHALEAAGDGDERVQGFERQAALLAQLHQVGIEAVANLVDARLDGYGGAREVGVAIHESVHRIVQHGDGEIGELVEFIRRDLVVQGTEQQHLARHALGIIAAAFEQVDDLAGRIYEAQMGGGGLMAHNEFQAELIERGVERVHILIAQNYGIRQLAIAAQKGMQRAGQRLFVQGQHFQELGSDQIDVVLEHGLQMRWRRRGQSVDSLPGDGNSITRRLQAAGGWVSMGARRKSGATRGSSTKLQES